MDRNKMKVSHLQFVDDIIVLCTSNFDNAWALKCLFMRNFEIFSGLKVNFNKCCLYRMNVSHNLIGDIVGVLGYSVGDIPFSYLGYKAGLSKKENI